MLKPTPLTIVRAEYLTTTPVKWYQSGDRLRKSPLESRRAESLRRNTAPEGLEQGKAFYFGPSPTRESLGC